MSSTMNRTRKPLLIVLAVVVLLLTVMTILGFLVTTNSHSVSPPHPQMVVVR